MSLYGHWISEGGLPAFVYDADQDALPDAMWDPFTSPPTNRHFLMLGNRSIKLFAANDCGLGLFDERFGARWLSYPEEGAPSGTSIVRILDQDGAPAWSMTQRGRPPGTTLRRVFGPTWFRVSVAYEGLSLERTVLCPEGESPWLLIRVRLANDTDRPLRLEHTESWAARPRFVNLRGDDAGRAADARALVSYDVVTAPRRITAAEHFDPAALSAAEQTHAQIFGPELHLALEQLGSGECEPVSDGGAHPVLSIRSTIEIPARGSRTLWYRFGLQDEAPPSDPESLLEASLDALRQRLPTAAGKDAAMMEREVPWHAALLSGGAARDGLIGGHTLDQASAYSYAIGFNGAARDPFQHALPLIYSEPDLALSVLRNTCAWAAPNGDMPYALDGAKRLWTRVWQPSDGNLWALWMAAEYAAATGDLAAFDAPLAYHPEHESAPAPLREHLRRQFRFFVDGVGLGEHGHVRMRNADWNDMAVIDSGVPRAEMVARGESVLNSAIAAWVLPVFAGLCDRLGESTLALEARRLGESLRLAVAGEWNGRWFRRGYAPGRGPIGQDDLWLEPQPWAILCGAAEPERGRELLATIDTVLRTGSPLGARVRWTERQRPELMAHAAEATNGGIWYSINMMLIWAARDLAPQLAWDELRRMSLGAHEAAYPEIWEGTLSGPDSYNAPEASRPGRTWAPHGTGMAMQSFPVNNLHSHSQPLLAYLRLLGVEPDASGALRTGTGGAWRSRALTLEADGHGSLAAAGPVTVVSPHGAARGGPGAVTW